MKKRCLVKAKILVEVQRLLIEMGEPFGVARQGTRRFLSWCGVGKCSFGEFGAVHWALKPRGLLFFGKMLKSA